MTDLIPYIWLALALLGLALAATSLRASITDFRTTKPTNGFRLLAIGDVVQEGLRTILYLIFTGMGVYYIVADLTVARSGVGWIMVGAVGILIVKTSVQLVVNYKLRTGHRFVGEEETQHQREDREFGEQRRELEDRHNEDRHGS